MQRVIPRRPVRACPCSSVPVQLFRVGSDMRRNIELKARCANLADAEATCRRLGARFRWTRRQTDTYFATAAGRLKLRVEEPGGAVLVEYHRPDAPEARESRYRLTPVENPGEALAALSRRHGVVARVVKRRTLYVLGNVRIHLDRVEGLGDFIEFEAVLPDERADDAASRAAIARLVGEFAISREDLCPTSYCDMRGSPPRSPRPREAT